GELSTFAAAEAAGLIHPRRPVLGTGSANQARRRAWAIHKATRQTDPLPPKPDELEVSPAPAQPIFSQQTRDVIARLVELGRADLVIAIAERRISPFQAARIADRGGRTKYPKTAFESKGSFRDPAEGISESDKGANCDTRSTEKIASRKGGDFQKAKEAEPEAKKPPALDVRALIA